MQYGNNISQLLQCLSSTDQTKFEHAKKCKAREKLEYNERPVHG